MTNIPVLRSYDYFMKIAFLTAMRSEDPTTKVGACIVNENEKVVGLVYNKAPAKGVTIPWKRNTSTDEKYLDSKYAYILYAEMDAILNKTCLSLDDCTMYTLVHPWNECAKLIIASGIKKVFYYSDKYPPKKYMEASKKLFAEAKVTCKQFTPENEKISQSFEEMASKTVNIPKQEC